jgi:hypothetical protein
MLLLHPVEGALLPGTGLLFVSQPPVGHRKKEKVQSVAFAGQGPQFLERLDRHSHLVDSVLSDAEQRPVRPDFRLTLEGRLGQLDGALGVAELDGRASSEHPS